ncbi:hypothetical protein BJ987_000831 [Nocardia goodfellowii]|uniref:Uncharacterized protein n=1 Tax=Nocardia goodfellowii TaxID=882446 RepID=A0ABS4Q8A6_9NOCA|nr:hypothetical protein [Nocardia goodfellowii]
MMDAGALTGLGMAMETVVVWVLACLLYWWGLL